MKTGVLCSFVVLLSATFLCAQTVTWDGGGDGVSWHDRFNWSGDSVPGTNNDVLIPSASATNVYYQGAQPTVRGLVNHATLWLRGGASGHATLAVSGDLTNHGTIRLQTVVGGWDDAVNVAGTLVNETDGVIEVNPGTGGGRSLTANVVNRGALNVTGGAVLYANGAGKVFRQETGSITATNLFTWAGGRFDFVGGALAGAVAIRSGALEVAASAGASTIICAESATLLANRATNAVVWVRGGLYSHATLTTAADAVNAGTIRLETSTGGWDSILNVGGSNFVNTASGTISSRPGTGGDRAINGYLVNRGVVDATGHYVNLTGTYEAAGGRILGGGRLINGKLKVTALPDAPTTVDLWGTTTLLTDVLPSTELWVHGGGSGHATLSAAGDVTNHGTIRLESTAGGWDGALSVAGIFVNAPSGVIQVNLGTGGSRFFTANMVNQGTINVGSGTGFYGNGTGKVFRQESGAVNATGLFTWAGGRFDFVGGFLTGSVAVRSGTLEVAATAGDSTIICAENPTLLANRAPGVTVQVLGGLYSHTTLTTAEGAVNAGTLRLDSINGGYRAAVSIRSSNFVNTATGVIDANTGSGGDRWISGNIINQGLVDATGGYLDLYGTYEAAGGRIIGAGRLRSTSVRVTAFPSEPTLLDLWGNTTLQTDNLTNTILWVHGGGDGHATLTVPAVVTNRGTLLLESTGGGYSETVAVGDLLVNAPEGTIQVNPGSGGGRALNGNVVNQGSINITPGITLYCGGANKVFRQEAGSINATNLFTWADGRFDFLGGFLTGSVAVRNGSLDVATTAVASTIVCAENSTLLANRASGVTVWVEGGLYSHATLTTAEGAINAGTLRLESINGGYRSAVSIGGSNFLNTATGVIDANAGTGGDRWISGSFVNQGLVDATGGHLDFWGEFEAAGGRVTGAARLRSTTLKVTGAPTEPTTLDLWGNTTLLTDILTNTVLWVHGGPDGHAALTAAGSVTNHGTLLLESSIGNYWEAVTIGGVLANVSEGVIQINPGSGGGRTLNAELINAGAVNVNSGVTLGRTGADHVNTGTLRLANTTATFTGDSFLNLDPGELTGPGTFNFAGVNFQNSGTVSPGASPGTLNFTGNFNQSAAGRLNIELGGLAPGSEYDRFAVSGTATLDGLLSVALVNEFMPALSNSFTVLTCSTLNGQFAEFEGLTIWTNLALEPQFTATKVNLQALAATNPPSAPIILVHPRSLSVIEGQTATFRLTANGTRPFAYQWRFNDADLPDATNATLVLPNVQTNQAGPYAVRVSNAAGSATSSNAALTVRQVTDLVIADIAAPSEAIAGQPVLLTWASVNQGSASAVGPWSESVAISTSSAGTSPQYLATFTFTNVLAPGASLNRTQAVVLPGGLEGSYYVVVTVDAANQIAEDINEANNISIAAAAMVVHSPDLAVARVEAPEAAEFGAALQVSWTVTNAGTAVASALWQDRVYLSSASNNLSGATLLATLSSPGGLDVGDSYTRTQAVTLPLNNVLLAGNYYLVVRAEAVGNVAESNEGNNLNSRALTLTLPPLPDLVAANVSSRPYALPGETTELTWAVTNSGTAFASGGWTEAVYATEEATSRPSVLLARLYFTNDLAIGAGLVRTQAVTLPVTSLAADVRFSVVVDSDAGIVESAETNNAAWATNTTFIPPTLHLTLPLASVREDTAIPEFAALIERNGSLSNAVLVALISSDTNELSVPPAVTIPAGQASATFPAIVQWDHVPDADASVTITASATGFSNGVATLNVLNVDVPQLVLTPALGAVIEGLALPVTVSRNPASDQPLVVSLASQSPTDLITPVSVTIPAYSNSASCNLTAPQDTFIESPVIVSFAASAAGHTSGASAVTVLDDDFPTVVLALNPASVAENAGASAVVGTVYRIAATSRELTLQLQASDSNRVALPYLVTIPANDASASFALEVVDDALINGTRQVGIAAYVTESLSGARIGEPATNQLTILDDDGPTISLTLSRTLLPEGSNTLATVTRNTATTNDLVVTLTSSDPTEATVPADITIPTGSNAATFTVSAVNDGIPDGTQPATLTASAAGFNSGVAVLQVTDINRPDLQLTEVGGPATGFTKAMASVSFRVANFGLAPMTNAVVQRVWFSDDALPGGDSLVGEFTFNQSNESIAPGLSFQQSITTILPLQPGEYWVIVTSDATDAAIEVDEANNTRVSSAPIHVVADFSATVQTGVTTASAGTVVPMTGLVTMANGQSPEGKLVNIHITRGSFRRVIGALAQADGSFAVNFRPLPNEAGIYTIGAAHSGEATAPVQDTFILLGAKFDPASLALTLAPAASVGGQATLRNLGDAPLTGLAVTPVNAPANLNVTAALATNTLPADGAVALSYGIAVLAETPSPAEFALRVTSAEGVTADLPVSITIRALQAELTAQPASLTAGMVVGRQKLVSFEIVNQGGATSGPVQIVLPQASWLAVAGPNPLPPLAPGETNSVTLQLTPAADLPLTAYDGQLAVLGGASALPVPFRFIAISEGRGTLEVLVEDENTYYTAGQPRVAGATVRLLDPFSRAVVAETLTGTNGTAWFLDLTEGPYTLQVEAAQHDTHSSPATVEAGLTNSVRAFVAVQTVAYRWSVVPTEVADRYRMTLETTFEANVPWPVVTVDQPLIVPLVFPGEVTQTEITLTNHGLLAAQGVVLNVRNTATYKITPLIRDIGELPARSSVTIPVLIQLQPEADQRAVDAIRAHTGGGSPAPRARGPRDGGWAFGDECEYPEIEALYFLICGNDRRWHLVKVDIRPMLAVKELAGCIGSIIENAPNLIKSPLNGAMGMICDCLVPAAKALGDWMGAPVNTKAMECICAVIGLDIMGMAKCVCYKGGIGVPEVPSDDGGGGGGSVHVNPVVFESGECTPGMIVPVGGGPASLRDTRGGHVGKSEGDSICAQVRLRLNQDLVLTRNAFRATLEIENRTADTSLTNVFVRLDFFDSTGANAGERFIITATNLTGLSGVDGSGVVSSNATGTAEFTLLPTSDAAPHGNTPYLVSGELRYSLGGQQFVIPLTPAPITVLPDPSLTIRYFHQRDVFSDDPYTAEIEPAIPYALGMIVQNTGNGTARNVRITSGQPKIVDNEKGLLIDFELIASEVAGQNLTPSLTVNLGDIPPGTNTIATWLFTSSLQGLFIDYSASFEHLDGLGRPQLSLVDGVEIHEMLHIVNAADDDLPDFLVNDTADEEDLPDVVDLSDGTVQPVAVVRNATADGAPSAGDLEVTLTAPMPSSGYGYLRVADPQGATGVRQFRLVAVRRAGGTNLPPENFWQTDRTFIGQGRQPIRENLLHLFDYASTDQYVLTYAPVAAADTTAPTSLVAALPAQSYPQIPLAWSGQDNAGGSGLAGFNIWVSDDGGPFTRWLERTTLTSAFYPGVAGHTYAFYSTAVDSAGNAETIPGAPDAQTTVSLINIPPMLDVGTNQVVDEGQTVFITTSAADTNAGQTLTFSLLSAPAKATIHPATGLVTWPTGETDGPGTNTFTVRVTDSGLPQLSAAASVTVVVREVNQPPILALVTNRTIKEGFTLSITNIATDLDLPPNQLNFSFGASAPPGATLNPTSGLFRWRPTETQGPSTNPVWIVVTDNGVPVASATQSFTVVVQDVLTDLTLSAGTTNLLAGERMAVPLRLNSALDVTNLSFELETDGLRLTNLTVEGASPEVLSVQASELSLGRLAISVQLDPALLGGASRTIASLGITALTNRGSAIVPVTLSQLQARRSGGEAVANTAASAGRVIIVEREPVLLVSGGPAPVLTLFGLPGRSYALLAATNLNPGTLWREFHRLSLAGRVTNLAGVTLPPAPSFFRALEVTDTTPRLELLHLGGNLFGLRLTGEPGVAYTVQSVGDLAGGTNWSNVSVLMLTNPAGTLYWTNETEGQRFFRARRP